MITPDKVPKDSVGAALEMWSHMVKTLHHSQELHKEDETFLMLMLEFMVDGEYIKAHNLMYGLTQTQTALIPPMISYFLNSYANQNIANIVEKLVD